MDNILGQYIRPANVNFPMQNWYRATSSPISLVYSTAELDARRKYEVLKHSNNSSKLTKAQKFSRLNNVYTPSRAYSAVTPVQSSASASGIPGEWKIPVIDSEFLKIPVNGLVTRTQYTSGSDNRYEHYNTASGVTFPTPFKVLTVESIDITNILPPNTEPEPEIPTLFINKIGAIDNKATANNYLSEANQWKENGLSSIFGLTYYTANTPPNTFTKLEEIISRMAYSEPESINVKLTPSTFSITPGSSTESEALIGYIGEYNNNVYFIANRDNVYLTETDVEKNKYTFKEDVLFRISATEYLGGEVYTIIG